MLCNMRVGSREESMRKNWKQMRILINLGLIYERNENLRRLLSDFGILRKWPKDLVMMKFSAFILCVCVCVCVCVFVGISARWHSGKKSARQCRRYKRRGFNPWVGKSPWSRKWLPTPVFLLEESQGQEEPGRLQSMESKRVKPDWTWLWILHEFTIYLTCVQIVVI